MLSDDAEAQKNNIIINFLTTNYFWYKYPGIKYPVQTEATLINNVYFSLKAQITCTSTQELNKTDKKMQKKRQVTTN